MKKFTKVIGSAIGMTAALALSVSTTQAQNLLTDPGFDLGIYTANPITPATVGDGWAGINGVPVLSPRGSSTDYALSSPNSYLTTMGPGDTWDFNGAYQAVGGIVAGQIYTASVSFLTTTGFGAAEPNWSGNPAVGAYVILHFNQDVAGLPQVGSSASINNTGVGLTPGTWYSESISAVAPAGATVATVFVAFMEDGMQTAPEKVYFDDASLIPAPEPSSLALLGMGLGIPFYFWRRRNS
jgi:hypothetical protein